MTARGGTGTWLYVCAVVGALMTACADEPVAIYVQPVYTQPCRFFDCGNGMCSASDAGEPMCLCEPGYAGTQCETCAANHHTDHAGRCVPDSSCAEQPENPCGSQGTCDDTNGVIECLCDEGYEGARCELCADRYDRDDLGRCLPIVLYVPSEAP